MAATPKFKVYNPSGEYVAACKHVEDAAAIVALYGHGSRIYDQFHRRVLWDEGHEKCPAGESYDIVAEVVYGRC